MCSSVLVVALLIISYQNVASDCTLSKGCFPMSANIAFGRNITANSTCGNPPREFEIPQSEKDVVDVCNATDSVKSHPAIKAIDNDSETFWKAEEYNFFVTLQLDFEYSMRLERSTITFRSFRPNRMILEKSSDFGVTWQPYQYYSVSCIEALLPDGLFHGLRESKRGGLPTDSTEAFCIDEDSIPSSPAEFGTVLFDATRFLDSRFDNAAIVDHVVVTNLRARFRDLSTLGDDLTDSSQSTLRKYFYAVTEWDVQGHCFCNGHADGCVQRPGEALLPGKVLSGCDCKHNTTGLHCDICLPLYNNKSWQRGNSTHANECEACDCHQHSTSCVYNKTRGYGVCQNCVHNTEGDQCGDCTQLHYRNTSVDLSDQNACVACACNVNGSVSMGCDSLGVCSCKTNVGGIKCDQCKAGFFCLIGSVPGGCQACLCSVFGTGPGGNSTCDPIDGSCQCKPNVEGKYCDRCKLGFYRLSGGPDVCTACGCSLSTAFSRNCDEFTGQCQCRRGLTGRVCNSTLAGQYIPFLEGVIYEAEEADLYGAVAIASQMSTVAVFTGTGYARLSASGHRVAWWVATPPRTIYYTTIIRYRAASSIQKVTVNITGEFSGGFYSCPGSTVQYSGSSIYYSSTSLPAAPDGSGAFKIDACLLAGRRIRVETTYQAIGIADMWLIDSMVLMPKREYINPATLPDVGSPLHNQTAMCYVNREVVSTYPMSLLPPCPEQTFLANAWLFNGTLGCDCDAQGAESNLCLSTGGQCRCRSNILGRTCSDCAYNHFGISSTGCQACGCSPLSSNIAQPCDTATGQCDCKPFTTGNQCDSCIDNYFNVSSCQPCGCDPNTSTSLQCNTSGDCQCNPGIGGSKCDGSCLPDYFRFTSDGCTACNCDPIGSVSSECNDVTGLCSCKPGTRGSSCDICKDGYFDFNAQNRDVCLGCFCYNHSSHCRSAIGYELREINSTFDGFQLDGWTGTTPAGAPVPVSLTLQPDGMINPVLRELPFNLLAYFNSPLKFLGNQRTSYAQTLSFELRLYQAVNGNLTLMTMVDGDVVIKGRSVAVPIVAALDTPPGMEFRNYKIQLVESNFFWGNLSGIGVAADRMFDVLNDIEYLRIRGGFGQGVDAEAQLDNVILGTAVSTGRSVLTNVANCSCPEGHRGLVCEKCKQGYKREIVNGTSYDPCVPCQCHGHSSDCDVSTGLCLNCADNTQGSSCEQCKPGYYGDATQGTASDCLPCPCPLTNGTNQFSPTCVVMLDGQVMCDDCPTTHTGLLCEACADGYFGQPRMPGSRCKACVCSGNVDLNRTGNCNTTTGECLKCLYNTAGPTCSQCADGFFGDAVSGTCQDCRCNVTGSVNGSCFGITGQCTCRPGVMGSKCDKCMPLHFGFNSGTGCRPCNCDSLGAQNSTCNADTGQCFCKVGIDADSRTCSVCGDSFYNKSDAGCQECMCNTSNTRNGLDICNKVSGQCPCLYAVTGSTCNACIPGFFGPLPNCVGCGDCYSNWTLLIEELLTQIADEDSRMSTLVRLHYGYLQPDSLTTNVTTLQSFLGDVRNYSVSVASLNETRVQLLHLLNALLSQLEADESGYVGVIAIVQQTEGILNTSRSFTGSVVVATGVYQASEDIHSLAASLNLTAVRLDGMARVTLRQIDQNATTVQDAKARADTSQLLVQTAVKTANWALRDSDAVWVEKSFFDSVYLNNSRKLHSITADRDQILAGLIENSESARNATASAVDANMTAGSALALAQGSLDSSRQEKDDADQLVLDSDAALQASCHTLSTTNQTKEQAELVLSTANKTAVGISYLTSFLTASDQSLKAANQTALDVLSLSLPSITVIQQLSRQINLTIIPEVEVNETTQQARDSKAQANSVLMTASNALNVSGRAADIVADTENLIFNTTLVRNVTDQAVEDTRSTASVVRACAIEVQNVTSDAKSTASQARNLGIAALDTVSRVESCRNAALRELEVSERATNQSCRVTSDNLLQNASRAMSSARALNATQAQVQAMVDHSVSNGLKQAAQITQEQVTRSALIEQINKLLEDYTRQKSVLESKREKLRAVELEVDSLVDTISASCGTGI